MTKLPLAAALGVAALQVMGAVVSAFILQAERGRVWGVMFPRDFKWLVSVSCIAVSGLVTLLSWPILRGIAGGTETGGQRVAQTWLADGLGYLIWTPLMLQGFPALKRLVQRKHPRILLRLARALGLVILTSTLVWISYYLGGNSWQAAFFLLYLPLLALLGAALRFSPTVVGIAVVCHAFTALYLGVTRLDWWCGSEEGWFVGVTRLQAYVGVNALITFLVSSVIHQREGAYRERLAVESQMQRLEDTYRQAISAANAVPYHRDYLRNEFTFMGDGILAMTGYDRHAITPDIWDRIVQQRVMRGELQGVPFQEAVRRTRAGEIRNWQCDSMLIVPTGEERWISDISVEVMNDQGVAVGSIGILIDVTDRRRAEEEVRRLNEGLEQRIQERTVRMQAAIKELESFTYSVSHDLRAPLRAIEGFTRILQEDHGNDLGAEGNDLLQRVRAAAVRMDLLIHSLLSFSRLSRQALVRRSVDMNLLVREVVEELGFEQKGRRVEFDIQTLPICYADAALIRQVWLNLISNAMKYTRQREVAQIRIGSFSAEDETVYWVKDNGVGFDMAFAGKLFGVFQRLHRDAHFDGTGVGLAIVHRILKRHEGSIWAESVPDQGATFFFKIGRAGAESRKNDAGESPRTAGLSDERSHTA